MNHDVNANSGWVTRFETSDFQESPRYDETMAYFRRLADHTGLAEMISFGRSPQGRELVCLVVAGGKEFTPEEAQASGKAIVLIQNGIHAGEIEGKDACMLLLREMLVTKAKAGLLEHLILLVIPILNVDGHERISPFNRLNQLGPREMGWRTTSQNLNLNRDYMKADTLEMQALLKLYSRWLPDLTLDNHTTNGADYQYHITYGIERHDHIDPDLSAWAGEKFLPYVVSRVEQDGFLTAAYVELKGKELEEGILAQPALPRFSTGYAALQNRVCVLVETHSLKPFENRVHSTKAFNTAALEYVNAHHQVVKELSRSADEETLRKFRDEKTPLPLEFAAADDFELLRFKGFEILEEESPITGTNIVRYTDRKAAFDVPLYNKCMVKEQVGVPYAYLIPGEFNDIIARIRLHGIAVGSTVSAVTLQVRRYKLTDVRFASRSYEGRQRVECDVKTFREEVTVPPGTAIVFTQQRTLRVIVNLLEPRGPDSYLRWGFFNAFLERKEYAEPFIMDPIARQMMERDHRLKREFLDLLANDAEFNDDPDARLDFFYQRSVYFDKGENVYPIMRVGEQDQWEKLL
jgi:hypothetical protein